MAWLNRVAPPRPQIHPPWVQRVGKSRAVRRFGRRSERDRHVLGGRPGVRRSVGADVILGGSAPATMKTTRRPTSTA
jgi:hypothetical protein